MQFHSNVSPSHRPRSPPPHYYHQQPPAHPVGTWDTPWNQLLDIDFSVDNVRSHLNNIDQDLNQAFQSIGMDRTKARHNSGCLVQTDWVENNVYNLKIPIYINVEPSSINVEIEHGDLCIKYRTTEKVREGEAVEEVYKKIPLPDNVNASKVRCIHKPQGYLFVEAPLKTGAETAHVKLEKDTSRVSQFADKDTSRISPSREKENLGQPQKFEQTQGISRGYYGPRRQFGTWADVVEKGRPETRPRRRFGEFQHEDQLGKRERTDLNLPIPPERAGLSPPRETHVYMHRVEKEWPTVGGQTQVQGQRYPLRHEEHHGPSLTEKAGEKWDQAKEKVGEGWDKTKDTAESGWEKVKEGAEAAKDKVAEGYEKTKEKVKEGAEKVKDTLTPSESHEQPKYQSQRYQYRNAPHEEEKPLTTRIGEVLEKPLDAYAEGMHKIQDAVTPGDTETHPHPHLGEERKYGTFQAVKPQQWEDFDNKPPRSTEGIQRPLIPTGETHPRSHWERGNLGYLHEDHPPHEQRFEQRHEKETIQQQPKPQVVSQRSDVSHERTRKSPSPEHEGKSLTEKIVDVLEKPLDVYAEGMHKIQDAVTPSETPEEHHVKPEKESKGLFKTGKSEEKEKLPSKDAPLHKEKHEIVHEEWPRGEDKPATLKHEEKHYVLHEQQMPSGPGQMEHKQWLHGQGPQQQKQGLHGQGLPQQQQKLHGQGIQQQKQGLTGRAPIPEMTEHHTPYLAHPTERTDIRPEHGTIRHEERHEINEGPLFLTGPQQQQRKGQEEKGIGEKISEKAHDAKEAVKEGAETVKEKVKEGAEKVKEGAQKVAGKIQEGWETTKDKASEGAEKVKEKAQQGKEKVQEGWEATKDKAQQGKEKVQEGWEATKDKAEQGKEKIQQGWEDTKDKAHEGKEQLKEGVEKGKQKAQQENVQQKPQPGKTQVKGKLEETTHRPKDTGYQVRRDVKETHHETKERPALHRQVEHLRKSPEKTGLPKPEKTGKSHLEKRESPEKESKPILEKVGETVGKAAAKVSQGFEAGKEKVKEAVTPSEKKPEKQVHKPEAHVREKAGVLKPQTKHISERVGEGVKKFEGVQQGQQYETVPRPFVSVETRDMPQGEYTKVTVDVAQGQKRIDPKTTEYSKAAIDVSKGGLVKEKGKDFSPSAV